MATPDRFWVKQIQRYDPNLSIRWNNRLRRFQILRTTDRFAYGRTHVVHTVQDPTGQFRPLDARTLRVLEKADVWRRGARVMREMLEAEEKREEAEDKGFRQDVRDMFRDRRKAIARDADQVLGALNVPRQDLLAALPDDDPKRQRVKLRARRGEGVHV